MLCYVPCGKLHKSRNRCEYHHVGVLLACYCYIWIWDPLATVKRVIFPGCSQIFWTQSWFVAPGIGQWRLWGITDLPTLKKVSFFSSNSGMIEQVIQTSACQLCQTASAESVIQRKLHILSILIWQSWFCYKPTGQHISLPLPSAPSWVAQNFAIRAKFLVPSPTCPCFPAASWKVQELWPLGQTSCALW